MAGARVSVLAHPRRPVARSRFVAELHAAPRDVKGALAALERLRAERAFDWVILGDDEILQAAARSGVARELLASKVAFTRAMQEARLPIPDSEVAEGPDAARAAAERIGYPVIVKPDRSSGGQGLFRADGAGDLDRVPDGAMCVVQRFIDGALGSSAFLVDGGRLLCWMSAFKEDLHPKPYGPSCARRYAHFPAMEARLEALAALLPGRHICGTDWILPSGSPEPLLIEMNGRPPPWLHLHERFGVDLPLAIRSMLEGSPRVVRPPETTPHAVVRMFPQDAIRALDEREWGAFLRAFLAWGKGYDAPRDDPVLKLALRWHVLRRAWKRKVGGPGA